MKLTLQALRPKCRIFLSGALVTCESLFTLISSIPHINHSSLPESLLRRKCEPDLGICCWGEQ